MDARNKSGHDGRNVAGRPAVTRSGPRTALPVTEGFRDEHPCEMPTRGSDMPTPRCHASARSAFADGNVDRLVESANVDIPARHLKDANVDPVAICLRDAYVGGRNRRRDRQADMHPVRKFKPGGSGLVPGMKEGDGGGVSVAGPPSPDPSRKREGRR